MNLSPLSRWFGKLCRRLTILRVRWLLWSHGLPVDDEQRQLWKRYIETGNIDP